MQQPLLQGWSLAGWANRVPLPVVPVIDELSDRRKGTIMVASLFLAILGLVGLGALALVVILLVTQKRQ